MREALLESFTGFFRAFPDSLTQPEDVMAEGEWGAVGWLGHGTFLGEMGGHAPKGRSFTLRGCGFFRVVAGEIVLRRGYIGRATWLAQIGLPIS